MQTRLDELDSLRGIAAIIVMNTHILLSFPTFFDPNPTPNETLLVQLLKYTPVHLLWAGHASVVFFFLLSGFVLAMPFLKGHTTPYHYYLIKRVLRIYTPYLAVIPLAFLGYYLFRQSAPIDSLSSWFNTFWYTTLDSSLFINHLLLIGNYNTETYLYTIWSLIHEMRISLFFPLIMLLVIRYSYRINIPISLFILGISPILTYVFNHFSELETEQYSSYIATLHYTAIFLIGALTAKYRNVLTPFIQSLSKKLKALLFLFAILLFTYEYWFFSGSHLLHHRIFNDISITIGSILFVFLGIGSHAFSRFLLLKPVHYIGKISYSLYLFHPVALLLCVKVLREQMPFWLIFLLAFILSIMGAAVLHRFVEIPSIRIGKRVTDALMQRANTSRATKNTVI